MKLSADSLLRYTDGAYAEENPTWHSEGSQDKADDLIPLIIEVVFDHLKTTGGNCFSFADIGGGAGLVCRSVIERLARDFPDLEIRPSIYEVSPQAARMSRENNPDISVLEKLMEKNEASYDTVLFVDVLEHIENPWECLRVARTNARYLIVRQPLLGNFPRFRHRDYEGQRNQWGHISCFNFWSFSDLAKATGWEPMTLKLLAPWELSGGNQRAPGFIKRILVRQNRVMSSFFIDGFYLLGVFKSKNDEIV
jgi:hypothetical protein